MATEITRTEIGPLVFERGNGKFAAILPDGERREYDIKSLNSEIDSTELVRYELYDGLAELLRAPEPVAADLGDEFIEFNDEARDSLIDDIVKRVESVIEDGLLNKLKFNYLMGDVTDAIADSVDGFGR